jgi:hypothetical protein
MGNVEAHLKQTKSVGILTVARRLDVFLDECNVNMGTMIFLN